MAPIPPLQWLLSTQTLGIRPGLDRMRQLLGLLGNPEQRLRCLHVAGTNGKGSVCAFAESVLRASGQRTGLHTSPHLVEFAERIRIGGVNAGERTIDEGIRRLQSAVVSMESDFPTFFELVTALAFDLFARAGCEVVVLETGLGGRLDATNTAPKIACAVTPVGLDHTEWLGETLGAISREKAGIFLPGVPAVSAPQDPEVSASLIRAAEVTGTPLSWVREPLPPGTLLGLEGPHQRWNAALALSLIRAAGFSPSEEAVTAGLREVVWPGRFQRLEMTSGDFRGEIILDGAHNSHAARRLAATWREHHGVRRGLLVFGALGDKDPLAILEELIPLASRIVLVPVASPRSADPVLLAAGISRRFGSDSPVVHIAGSLREILVDNLGGHFGAQNASEPPVLLAGSLFLVGEALAMFSGSGFLPRSQ